MERPAPFICRIPVSGGLPGALCLHPLLDSPAHAAWKRAKPNSGVTSLQPQYLSSLGNSEEINEDRATAAILTGGGADGVPALALRHWRQDGSPAEPVFITWLLGVGRFCLTVKYGRYSLRGSDWHVDAWSGLRSTPLPLDQAHHEALRVSEALQRRLNRQVPVSPALVLFDMEGDRRIERLARRRRIPLLWNLERYTDTLADAAAGSRHRQSLDRSQALAEISALVGDPPSASVRSSIAGGRRSQFTTSRPA